MVVIAEAFILLFAVLYVISGFATMTMLIWNISSFGSMYGIYIYHKFIP